MFHIFAIFFHVGYGLLWRTSLISFFVHQDNIWGQSHVKEIYIFMYQGCIKLIKQDVKDII